MPWSNDPGNVVPGRGGQLTTGGGNGGRTMGGDPQPPQNDPTGFGGLAHGLGLSSNYQAKAASADYGGRGYGSDYASSGAQQAGTQAGQVASGDFGFGRGPNYAAYQGLDGRVAGDYARAAQQAGNIDYSFQQAKNLANVARQEGLDQSAAQQMAMAKSGNPMQGGMAAYNAQAQGAQMGQEAVRQGIVQSQQMNQAYDQMRLQQDLQNRQMNLGLLNASQQNTQFGANYGLNQAQMQQDLYKALLGQQMGYAQMSQQGQEAYAGLASANYNAAQGLNAGASSEAGRAGGQVFGAAMGAASGAAGGAAMMSDERVKEGTRYIGRKMNPSEAYVEQQRRMSQLGRMMGGDDAYSQGMQMGARLASMFGGGSEGAEPQTVQAPLNTGKNLGAPGGPEVYDLTSSQANAVPARPAAPGLAIGAPTAGPPVGVTEGTKSLTSDENAKEGTRYVSHDYAGKAKHNDPYRSNDYKGTDTYHRSPETRAAALERGAYADSMFSDERVKSHTMGGGNAVDHFLGTLDPVEYRYKAGVPGEDPRAQRYGILAQDVERSPMGRSLVEETPIGKAINVPHATGALLAGEGELYARQRRLEAELHALRGGR